MRDAFAVGVVAVGGLDRQRDIAAENQRVFTERRRQPAQPLFPFPRIDRIAGRGFDVHLGLFARKVGRRIVVLNLRRGVGARASQRFGRLPVGPVGPAPELEANRRLGVGQRQVDARDARPSAAVAAQRMRVVERVVADADFHRCGAGLRLIAPEQGADRCGKPGRPGVVNRVADEVGGIRRRLERSEIPLQLCLHDPERGISVVLCTCADSVAATQRNGNEM